MGTTEIRPFPGLRALAEEEARARFEMRESFEPEPRLTWDRFSFADLAVRTELALLCDLNRPASQAAVARLVAAKIGWVTSDVIAAINWNWNLYVALHRTVGLLDPDRWEPHPSAATALSVIVGHLWPVEVVDG